MWNEINTQHGRQACYYITCNTVDWVDVFIRPVYKQVIVHTLNHFIEHKGLIVYSWCLMSNRLHLLARSEEGYSIEQLEEEYRAFTTRKIIDAIDTEPKVRKSWMMDRFGHFSHMLSLNKKIQVWQNCSNPQLYELRKTEALLELFDHIHNNPVRDRIVDTAHEYLYSSARDFSGINGLVKITKLPHIEQQLAAPENMNGSILVKYIRN